GFGGFLASTDGPGDSRKRTSPRRQSRAGLGRVDWREVSTANRRNELDRVSRLRKRDFKRGSCLPQLWSSAAGKTGAIGEAKAVLGPSHSLISCCPFRRLLVLRHATSAGRRPHPSWFDALKLHAFAAPRPKRDF